MTNAGWDRGVSEDGGTYYPEWDEEEKEAYRRNARLDVDSDGHACEAR